jgi:hypothetical protein
MGTFYFILNTKNYGNYSKDQSLGGPTNSIYSSMNVKLCDLEMLFGELYCGLFGVRLKCSVVLLLQDCCSEFWS